MMAVLMTVQKAFAWILAFSGSFALLGTLIGFCLGRWMPSYYRSVFEGGNDASFDPIAVGVGQGVTQGFVGGGILGVMVVGLLIWRDGRRT